MKAWLDGARVLAVMAVVVLHVAAVVVVGSPVGSGFWWVGNLADSGVRWSVPVLVMISGALLLDPDKNESLSEFYSKRAMRILVPLLFWSLFYLWWGVCCAGQAAGSVTWGELAKKWLSGTPHYHLWYLYMILPLYLFTPFFRFVVRMASRREIAVLVVIAFALAWINNINSALSGGESKLFVNWFLYFIPYYFLGYLISTDQRPYPRWIWCAVFLGFTVLTAIGCYLLASRKGLEAGLYFYGYLSITVVPASIAALYLLKFSMQATSGSARLTQLSALTLGIYLIHPLVLETLQKNGMGAQDYHPALSIPSLALLAFILSGVVTWVIGRLPHVRRVV